MSKLLYPLSYVTSAEQVTLKFRLQLTTSGSAPDFQVPAGSIASATGAGSGVYTITLQEKYPVFLGGRGEYWAATNTAFYKVNIAGPSAYVASTGVLTFTLVTDANGDGTYAAADGVENDWIWLELTFAKVSTAAPSGAIPA